MAEYREEITIFTDGSEKNKRGTWAYIAYLEDKLIRTVKASVNNTTSNQMELYAVIQALQYYKNKRVLLITDSQYVQRGYTTNLNEWANNNWKGSRGKIKYLSLWKELYSLKNTDIQIVWMKRNSTKQNMLVDNLTKSYEN